MPLPVPASRSLLVLFVQQPRLSVPGNHLGRDDLDHLPVQKAVCTGPGRKAPDAVMDLPGRQFPVDETVLLF